MNIRHPKDYDWRTGKLPPVETVNYDCRILLLNETYVGVVIPWGDSGNPLRWCDTAGFPIWGIDAPSGYWTYLTEGTDKPRPQEIKTWHEFFSDIHKELATMKLKSF